MSMIFYILTPYKIEAYTYGLQGDFLADDLLAVIQAEDTKIVSNKDDLSILERSYPKFHKYEIKIGKL